MFFRHVGGRMRVTAETGIRRSTAWVAGDTSHDRILAVSEREDMRENGRLPGCGGMTGGAVRPGLARVRILALMTGVAILGRAGKDSVDMTTGAGSADMRPSQREGGQVVVKTGGLPA